MRSPLIPFLLITLFLCGAVWARDDYNSREDVPQELSKRVNEGDSVAMFVLARMMETGKDRVLSKQDSSDILSLYKSSAAAGYGPAMNYLGFRYYKGDGLKHDVDSAIFWIKKAADLGDITAATNLGYLFLESPEIPRDETEAVKWLAKAAEAGVNEAQFKLIELKEDEWRKLPLDSVLNLGINYYTAKSPIMGVHLIEIAAESENPKALALLGDAYSKGLGVPYDHKKSNEYFFRAAKDGDPSAQFIVGELLEIFPDIFVDRDDEIEEISNPQFWYDKAAAQGVNDSQRAFTLLYQPLLSSVAVQ